MPSDDLLTSPASIMEVIVESCAAPTSLVLACGCGTSQGSAVTPSVSHTASAPRSWSWKGQEGRYRWGEWSTLVATRRRKDALWLPEASNDALGCRQAGERWGRQLLWEFLIGRPCSKFIVLWRGTWILSSWGSCCGSDLWSVFPTLWWSQRAGQRLTHQGREASRQEAQRQRNRRTKHLSP